jgi:iron only hydrogenase large subunit-like protein
MRRVWMKNRVKMVVLNPVIESMLGKRYLELISLLESKGYFVENSKRGIEYVRTFYGLNLFFINDTCQIDSRCPKITELIVNDFPYLLKRISTITPILITGAYMAFAEFLEKNPNSIVDLTIISPCEIMRAYEKMNNGTKIITWKKFKEIEEIEIPENKLDESPVPLGFFNSKALLGEKIYSASGEKDCKKLLSNIPKNANLLELLWCEGGCHKGDGL